jgi:phosphoribosylanthranilate isomerase
MREPTWIKICGATLPSDIELLCSAGADAVGLNFIPRSKRYLDVKIARKLADLAQGRLEVIGVVEDLEEPRIRELVEAVGLDRVQLHGNEPGALLERLGKLAYKAVGVASEQDVRIAELAPGEPVLVDAKVGALVGGTGTTFDWGLVEALCRARSVVVAGGLHPGNVGAAVQRLAPYGIDVASGVEVPGCPRQKDADRCRDFVAAVRRADALIAARTAR